MNRMKILMRNEMGRKITLLAEPNADNYVISNNDVIEIVSEFNLEGHALTEICLSDGLDGFVISFSLPDEADIILNGKLIRYPGRSTN
jgi:hypothetical protein